MELNARLDAALNLLENDLILADVGCDHGYLSIKYCKKTSKIVYAIDNKVGPLNACKSNINEYQLNNKITTILSDGLNNCPDDVEQICICGMGGSTIVDILENAARLNKLDNTKILVLQANSGIDNLRKYLNEHNFGIIDEKIVEDKGFIYEVIKANKSSQKLDEKDYKFGPILRKQKDKLFVKKWENRKNILENILKENSSKSKDNEQFSEYQREIKEILEELKDEI